MNRVSSLPGDSDRIPKVGILVVGHGNSASALLSSARHIVHPRAKSSRDEQDSLDPRAGEGEGPGEGVLARVQAVDAGEGYDRDFERALRAAAEGVDQGAGLLVLVDLFGSSPCSCCLSSLEGRNLQVVTGLNLAMLLKLGTLPEPLPEAEILAGICRDVGRRAIMHRGGES